MGGVHGLMWTRGGVGWRRQWTRHTACGRGIRRGFDRLRGLAMGDRGGRERAHLPKSTVSLCWL